MTNRRGKVLIVDDSMDQIDLLTEILIEDYDTICAFSGKQAIDMTRRTPQPDLILLDIIIPAPDGYEVCEILSADERTSHIPVILITGLSGNNSNGKKLPDSVAGIINKPYNIHELKNLIKQSIYHLPMK